MELLTPIVGGLFVVLVIAILLFLLLRSIVLWYWNIDKIVDNQEEQTKILKEQKELLAQIYHLQGGQDLVVNKYSPDEVDRKAKLFDESQNKKLDGSN